MLDLDADTRRLALRMTLYARRMPDVARRVVNSTAFYLRDETPDYIDEMIDRPTRATRSEKSYVVDMARGSDVEATLRAKTHVNSYLRQIQFGLDDDYVHMPLIASATDKHGNLKRRFHFKGEAGASALMSQTIRDRRSGAGGQVGKYFYGLLSGSGAPALFERYAGNKKVRAISARVFGRRGKKTISLVERWRAVGGRKLRTNFTYWMRRFLDDPQDTLPRDLRR